MNTADFTHLLEEPNAITKEQNKAIEAIIEKHPYFQAARVLNLKSLKNQQSIKYNDALKVTAAYTTNRTVLFDFITKNSLDVAKAEEEETELIENSEIVDLELIEDEEAKKKQQEEAEEISIPILEETLEIGKPLEFDKNETHSFNEWLKLTTLTPIKREEKLPVKEEVVAKEKEEAQNTFDLIDKFLEKKPKIEPIKSIKNSDISTQSVAENDSVMTETLARVYLEQKKYDQAIKAFKILSLKYPEKSGFFADRIRAVEFLKDNNS